MPSKFENFFVDKKSNEKIFFNHCIVAYKYLMKENSLIQFFKNYFNHENPFLDYFKKSIEILINTVQSC